jgi:segregation and condensation protein B
MIEKFTIEELKSIIEALIYVSDSPVTLNQIEKTIEGADKKDIKKALDELIEDYKKPDRSLSISQVAGGYQMHTRPQYKQWIETHLKRKNPFRLSREALETLSIIAYKQPITTPELAAIRGVDVSGSVHSLLEKKLIKICGRKEVVGRPLIYKTTKEFLICFGLKDLSELPSLEELEEMMSQIEEEDSSSDNI